MKKKSPGSLKGKNSGSRAASEEQKPSAAEGGWEFLGGNNEGTSNCQVLLAQLEVLLGRWGSKPSEESGLRKTPHQLDSREEREWHQIRQKLSEQLQFLRDGAHSGKINDLKALIFIATEAAHILRELSDTNGTFVSTVAREQLEWPIVVHISDSKRVNDFKYFENVGLGSAMKFRQRAEQLDRGSPALKWAAWLWQTLELYEMFRGSRDILAVEGGTYEDIFGIPYPCFDDVFQQLKKLPCIEFADPKELWPLANEVLDRITAREPWRIKSLAGYAKNARVQERSGSSKIKRTEIVKQVRQAFIALARSKRA